MTFPKKIPANYWLNHSKFALPKVITFDAYNTLYCPTLPVMEQYSEEGKKFGINVPSQILTERFPHVYVELKSKFPNYGKAQNLTANEWWAMLIKKVFLPHDVPNNMVESILNRFEGKQAYAVYPDVLELLQFLTENYPETVIAIISNTDPNVHKLLENLEILRYFKDFTYFSYEIELSKPNPRLFDYVLNDILEKRPDLLSGNETVAAIKKRCWHIGDEVKNDFEAAEKVGWNSVLIDRTNSHGYFNVEIKANTNFSEYDLSVQKVDQNMNKIWQLCKEQEDVVQTDSNSYVLSNLYSFKNLFL